MTARTKKSAPQTITGEEIRALRRAAKNGQIAATAALTLLRNMEEQKALRVPFPGLDEVVRALKGVAGER